MEDPQFSSVVFSVDSIIVIANTSRPIASDPIKTVGMYKILKKSPKEYEPSIWLAFKLTSAPKTVCEASIGMVHISIKLRKASRGMTYKEISLLFM